MSIPGIYDDPMSSWWYLGAEMAEKAAPAPKYPLTVRHQYAVNIACA